jgi:malate permease and related proteins
MLLTFLTSVESILPIAVIILVGFVMARVGWINEKVGKAFTKLILNISLPCYMIWNFMSSFNRDKFITLFGGILIPVLSMSIAYIAAIAISNIIKVPKGHKGVFRSVFFCSNTIFVGLPINLALFGEKSVPYVLLYYIVNTTFFWTVGTYEISRDGMSSAALFSKATLKRIASPALIGFIIAIILVLLQVELPSFAMESIKYLGNLTTPLALIFIGLVLSAVPFSQFKFNREIIFMLFGRFILSPLLVILLLKFIHVPPLMGKVFIIQSAMPAMTNTSIVAKGYGADYKFASVATVITTVACIIVIPSLMIII